MKNAMLAISHFWLYLFCGVVLAGCVHRYPTSESDLKFTYPLENCNPTMLKEAQKQAVAALGQQLLDQKTVCRTAPGSRHIAFTTPLTTSDGQPDMSCQALSDTRPGPDDETAEDRQRRLASQADSSQERCLRDYLETPFLADVREKRLFGIALSGGGSKAGAYAIGVLAGLSDLGMLDSADYVSSVSGGSYAAYFYYAHRLLPVVRQGAFRIEVSTAELFRDCVALPPPTDAERNVIDRIYRGTVHCDRKSMQSYLPNTQTAPIRDSGYQALLKCTQDLMRPGTCSMDATSSRRKGISLPTWGGSIATILPSFVSNSLFDWGWSTSPSAISYQDGIGLAYGATLVDTSNLTPAAVTHRTTWCGYLVNPADQVLDCTSDILDPDPMPLTFDELRAGLLTLRARPGNGVPFWILNAAAPQYRSMFGWLRQAREDISNSDMFEMTAVSHGSGRYGYVSASPSIHGMNVLDSVRASAAFLDANQLVLSNRFVRTGAGLAQHLANLDWGLDIANYNVSTTRRQIHRALPFPLYYLDSLLARGAGTEPVTPERRDRERSVFIRLIDGGNAENLGAYSLLKRGVRTILISDAAGDSGGQFADLCGLRKRLEKPSEQKSARYIYFPGLSDFAEHCRRIERRKLDSGYNLHSWFNDSPLLLGCVRNRQQSQNEMRPCHGLELNDVRLLVAKPALNLDDFQRYQIQPALVPYSKNLTMLVTRSVLSDCWVRGSVTSTHLLNCDTAAFLHFNRGVRKGDCPIFPQHSTVLMTANSSATLFVAYRELARQQITRTRKVLEGLLGKEENISAYEDALDAQTASPRKVVTERRCTTF